MLSGILSGAQIISTAWRTTLSTPPRFNPGESSSFLNSTWTSTLILVVALKRMKSTCRGRSVTGSVCRSRARTRCVSPSTLTSKTREKNPGPVIWCAKSTGSREISTGSILLP